MKRKDTEWEKVFARLISNKEPLPKIYRVLKIKKTKLLF